MIVKREDDSFEFEKESDGTLTSDYEEVPVEVIEAVEEKGFGVESLFPKNITVYAHDEATPHDRHRIAEELGREKTHEIGEIVGGITYEVEFTVKVYADNSYEVRSPTSKAVGF